METLCYPEFKIYGSSEPWILIETQIDEVEIEWEPSSTMERMIWSQVAKDSNPNGGSTSYFDGLTVWSILYTSHG